MAPVPGSARNPIDTPPETFLPVEMGFETRSHLRGQRMQWLEVTTISPITTAA
jgi:hypothetical protein